MDAAQGTRLTIALASSNSPDRCLFTDTRGMRAVNRCSQHMMTLLGLEWTLLLILTPPPKGIIVGLIHCPWCGILLFIETMQKILSTSTQPRYSPGPLAVTWLNVLPKSASAYEALTLLEIRFIIHQYHSAVSPLCLSAPQKLEQVWHCSVPTLLTCQKSNKASVLVGC